jgi:hypothetical protein
MQVQTPVNPHNEVCSLRVHALIHERVVAEDVHYAFYASDKMLRMKSLVARFMHTLAPSTPFPDNHSGCQMLSMGTLLLPVVERTVSKLAGVRASRVPFCSSIQDIMAPLLHFWLTCIVVVMYI